jgi:hypothetical protein
MDFVRVFSDENGVACFESIDPVNAEQWSRGWEATRCNIREMPAGLVMDWHPAPRRQIVIHLEGQLEIELRDGTVHRFEPGSARLMEDVAGTGHLTRVVSEGPVIQAVIFLT